ncbi:MAG TPA: LysM peptidoglycan-binding domain-containing protein [Terrimicrobiaceae bacterium]
MFVDVPKFLTGFIITGVLMADLLAQAPDKPTPPSHVEPGLENAVKWKWNVAPSDPKSWGLELPDLTHLSRITPPAASPPPEAEGTLYEVKRGDALFLIGKRFGISVARLKEANGLTADMIRIGQILKIPAALASPTPSASGATTANPEMPTKSPISKVGAPSEAELKDVRLQVFLDREQFSAGPIVGKPGPAFRKIVFLYQSTHEEAKDDPSLEAKAEAAISETFVKYTLKAEDFRFIAPPKAEIIGSRRAPAVAEKGVRGARPSSSPAISKTPLRYEQLTAAPMLAYRSPWEFVAERFHCNESYLHGLNGNLPSTPAIGAEFKVPNVIPFEIENAFNEPLQPQADPENPVTAAVVGFSQLNIYRRGILIAAYPLSSARPGLRGRGTWTILNAISRPKLATRQEDWKEQAKKPPPLFGSSTPTPTATPSRRFVPEQFLPAGPRNPAGIIWINLAKSDNPHPLPYGLHGTSIPDQMNVLESVGGLRLTNWDIARAVRELPSGTPLEWKP